MTLEQVFFVSQSIAAAAVVASILYLAREVRQSERVQRATMQQGRADRASHASLTIASTGLSRIWQKALSPNPDLTQEEFSQWSLICRSALLSGEDSYLQHKAGLLDEVAWGSYVAGVHFYMASPGMRAMWRVSSKQFGSDFREFVDGILSKVEISCPADSYLAWQQQLKSETRQAS
jgi:protein-disulfide isomerase-like protein with CxxC motif